MIVHLAYSSGNSVKKWADTSLDCMYGAHTWTELQSWRSGVSSGFLGISALLLEDVWSTKLIVVVRKALST